MSGNYIVPAAGIYATIDMQPTKVLLDELHLPPSASRSKRIEAVEADAGRYQPLVLIQVGIAEFESGHADKGVFWFHAGLLRAILDVRLCADKSVGDAPSALVSRTPPALLRAAMTGDAESEIVRSVTVWDAKTPYNYDHRWIAHHGAWAASASLDPSHAPTVLTIPKSQWPAVMVANREAYPAIVAQIGTQIARQSSALPQAPSPK